MSRWPQRSWRRPSACRRRRRAEFCCRRLTTDAAQRATRLAVRRYFQGHRGRPRGLQPWPGSGSRRPWPACGTRASFFNYHVHTTHSTSRGRRAVCLCCSHSLLVLSNPNLLEYFWNLSIHLTPRPDVGEGGECVPHLRPINRNQRGTALVRTRGAGPKPHQPSGLSEVQVE